MGTRRQKSGSETQRNQSRNHSRTISRSDEIKRLKSLETFVHPPSAHGGDVRIHLVYPNSYWIAMSNLGFQAVYGLFSKIPGVVIERAFLPDDAFEEKVFKEKWRTFESSRLLSDCDILAFSLSFETDYPHLLRILNNAGLLFNSADERMTHAEQADYRLPLILAGGTAITLNPEPVADLLDMVFLGEAEEFIPELVERVRSCRDSGKNRLDTLLELSEVEGVYVPRIFEPQYATDDSISAFLPVVHDGKEPTRAQRRFVKDLSKFPTYTNILTPETEFRSMFLTETGRGCEMGCRFCVAGYIYRPVRKRSEESVSDSVKIGLESSQAVGFVGAAVSSHKSISKLAQSVAEKGARASLSSLMSQKVTKELAASLSESEYKTVALAPEAGSERLRRAAGKRVSNAQVLEAAKELAEAGIKGFKLYFIVGLPTETDADVDAIADLAIEVRNTVLETSRSSGKAAWVVLSVNPFIPKASTPFQWEPMLPRDVLEAKLDTIRQRIKTIPNIEMNAESPRESYFQALLSRGDRRVAKLLIHAEREGRDWKWLLAQAAKGKIPGVPALDFYATRRIPFDQLLPWQVVDSRIDPELLRREAERAHATTLATGSDDDSCNNAPTSSLFETTVMNEVQI